MLTCHDDNDDDDDDDYVVTCHSDPLHIPPGRCIPQCPCYTPNKCNVTPIDITKSQCFFYEFVIK